MPAAIKLIEWKVTSEDQIIDTILSEQFPNGNYGLTSLTETGNSAGNLNRSIIKFDLSIIIPPYSKILGATLSLRARNVGNDDPYNVSLHRGLVNWYEGNHSGGGTTTIDGSTWNNKNHIGTIPWDSATPGGTIGVEFATIPTDTVSVGADGLRYEWNVTADVQDWYYGIVPNYGWWMIGEEANPASRKQFFGANEFGDDYIPIFNVLYSPEFLCACGGTLSIPAVR